MTAEEYLQLERAAEFRHEFADGRMFERANARFGHARITANLIAAIHRELRHRNYTPFAVDMRVRAGDMFAYPDVMVVSGAVQLLDEWQDTVLNPTLILEVLSPKTERFDRGMKFRHYSAIESLRQYVLVASDSPCIEVFTRSAEGWRHRLEFELAARIPLSSIGCALDLAEVYEDVEFDTEAGA
jgi:Uma2 family endonuclease